MQQEIMFGAPGMAQYLLAENELITPIRRKRLTEFPNGVPTQEGMVYVEDTDPALFEELQIYFAEEAAGDAGSGTYSHAWAYFSLLLSFAVYSSPSVCSFTTAAECFARAASQRRVSIASSPCG